MIGRYCLILIIYISCEPGPNRPSCVQRIGVMCLAVRREITCASRVYADIPEFARFFFSCGSLPRSTQNSLPREIPWRELTGIAPSFARPARCKATGHAPGAGTGEPPSSYGAVAGSIDPKSLLGRARGYLGDRSASRLMPPAVGRGCRAYARTGIQSYAKSLIISRMRDDGSRHVAPLRRWLR